MAQVSLIGTGTMGSALIRALIHAGHRVHAWNRTPTKSAPLRAIGAQVADSFQDAVGDAELVIMCIANYEAAAALLAKAGHTEALRGRTLVQLSTGSALDAKEAAGWMRKNGIPYLDGAIVAYPSDIGAEHCLVLYGGSQELFLRHQAVFRALGGRPQWCGEDVGTPNALDSSLLLFLTSGLLGYLQSAALADAEGVPFDALLTATVAVMDVLVKAMPDLTKRIAQRHFGEDQFPIDGYAFVAKGIRDRARVLGLKPGLMNAFGEIFADAQAAGRGSDGLATLFETAFAK